MDLKRRSFEEYTSSLSVQLQEIALERCFQFWKDTKQNRDISKWSCRLFWNSGRDNLTVLKNCLQNCCLCVLLNKDCHMYLEWLRWLNYQNLSSTLKRHTGDQLQISTLVLLTCTGSPSTVDIFVLDHRGCSQKHTLMSIVSAELTCCPSIPGNNWAFLWTLLA